MTAGEGHETRACVLAINFDLCPCRLAEFGLPKNGVGTAGENHLFAGKSKKYRQAGKVPHQRAVILFPFASG
jgi:hypothetical protein